MACGTRSRSASDLYVHSPSLASNPPTTKTSRALITTTAYHVSIRNTHSHRPLGTLCRCAQGNLKHLQHLLGSRHISFNVSESHRWRGVKLMSYSVSTSNQVVPRCYRFRSCPHSVLKCLLLEISKVAQRA